MTNHGGLQASDDLELSITPALVRQWLSTQRWGLVQAGDVAELWARPEGWKREAPKTLLLPLARDFVDFERRFRSTLHDLGKAYNLTLAQLVQEIASVSADIFFVRLGQATSDGTIPFKQAAALLASIQKMVRAAATTAANPQHAHVGRRPAAVTDFLAEDLRFGHTKRGSFIVTVAARLDDTPTGEPKSNAILDTALAGDGSPAKPFARRVMETLASGLVATKRHLADDAKLRENQEFETSRHDGMSYELVQSLLEVSDVIGLREVDLSFQWAKAGPPPPPKQDITIHSSEVDRLKVVRDRLRKVEAPEEQTLTGRVTDLSREEMRGGHEERSILLEAEFDGRLRKLKVPLTALDYDWAIFAHQRRLPLTVSGTPVKRGRWFLEGAIAVDTRFLEILRREEEAGRGFMDPRPS